MKQNTNKTEDDARQYKPPPFLEDTVSPGFVKWMIRIVFAFWILMIIVIVPDYVDIVNRIMTTIPPGSERCAAFWELFKAFIVYLLILPCALLFIAPWLVGISPQGMFLNSQFGNVFTTIFAHVRIKKDKPRKKA